MVMDQLELLQNWYIKNDNPDNIYFGVLFFTTSPSLCDYFRMKKKYYSWDECLNLREVKVSEYIELRNIFLNPDQEQDWTKL